MSSEFQTALVVFCGNPYHSPPINFYFGGKTIHFIGFPPMLMPPQKRTLTLILTLLGTFWTALTLLAQPQPLPQLPQSQAPQSQIPQNQTPQHQADFFTKSLPLTLTRTPVEKLEQALRQTCGHRFAVESQYQYVFTSNRNNVSQRCTLRMEPQTRQAVLSGDPQLCEQVFLLITAIDQPPPPGKDRQIIPYQYASPDVLVKVFEFCRTPVPKPTGDTVVRQINPNPDPNSNPIRQVNHQFEGGVFEGGADPAISVPGMQPGFQSGFPPGNIPAVGLPEDFKYMFIPSLDVVVVEATGPRLQRFLEMIQQLEELSKINRPTVEIVYLEHINNVALGNIITQDGGRVYNDIFMTIPGNVRFLPMTSPNAMMLIGWGEAMETAKTLLKDLDKPTVTEHSRLHIFKLKHISAAQARTTLASTFPVPTGSSGFMARVQLFVDSRSNTLIVQAAPNDLEEVKRVIQEIDVATSPVKLQMKRIQLNNSLAPDMETTLRNAITGSTSDNKVPAFELLVQGKEGQRLIEAGIMSDVTISTDVRNNTLIVRAPESCMPFIDELVALLDVPSPEAEIKIFQIEHADAASLIDMFTSLFPTKKDGVPGPQLPGTVRPEGEDALIPIRFAVDKRSNSIIVAGSRSELQTVEALVNSLDREDLLSRKQFVYPLKNMKAVVVNEAGIAIGGVATTINEYIRSRLKIQTETPGVISPYQQIESAVIVVPEIETNSLIISATPKYYDEIIELIKDLDRSPPQVVIRVLIAEVTLSKNKEWASEIGLQDPLMFARTTIGANNVINGGLLFNNNPATSLGNPSSGSHGTVGAQMLSNFGAGRVGDSGFGGLVFSANSEFINIMLRALHEDKRMEVLSSPQITTMNNQIAVISVGQKVPRYEGVTTTNYGVTPNVKDIEVGLMLMVTPTISPEGTIVMKLAATKEKVGAESDGILIGTGENGSPIRSPKIDRVEVGTMISAANNETVILGGLITKEENKIRRKVPVLGDIPVLGKFWRHEINQVERKELLVILTPRIVQGQEDLAQIKQMEMARMSWCLSNVVQVHGDVGAYDVVSERPYTGNAPVVSPGPVKMETLQPIDPQFLAPTLPKRE